jgi:type II secretory pathway pseudopilin PulG
MQQKLRSFANRGTRRSAITLVELLVVIALMSILTVLIIPRIRVVNKDRNIREVARVVGAAFASARDRAVLEGAAGLAIVRNPNFVDSNDVYYAATALYSLRSLPPYSGDFLGETADVQRNISTNEIEAIINKPLEHDTVSGNLVVQVNDGIRLNHGTVRYRIANVAEDQTTNPVTLKLTLDFKGAVPGAPLYPEPPIVNDVPFLIDRQPRRMESSRIDLPAGNFVDLHYSGPLEGNTMLFAAAGDNYDIKVLFDRTGGIDRIYFGDPTNPMNSRQPQGSLYFLVVDDDLGKQDQLDRSSNLWVSVNNVAGGVNIGYNAPPPTNLSFPERLASARGLARIRRSADQ